MSDNYEDIEDYEDGVPMICDDGKIVAEQLLRSGHLPTVHAQIKDHRCGDRYIILYQNPHDDIVMSSKQFMGLMGMFLNLEVDL